MDHNCEMRKNNKPKSLGLQTKMPPSKNDPPPAPEGKISSLPGFQKYPTFRDESTLKKSGLTWLEGKRHDDNAEGLWRIYDNLYDLTPFIKTHPGGPDWLTLTKGTDITEAFEVHHISNAPKELMKKFFVRKVNTPRNSPYLFEEDGFYKTLKRRVKPILDEHGTGPTNEMKLIHSSLFASSVFLMLISAVFNSYLLAILSGIIVTFTIIASHNFLHQKDNWRMYVWDLSFMSFYDWRITHSMSHHIYTNTYHDWEISSFEPDYQFLPIPKTTWEKYGCFLYLHFVNATAVFTEFARRIYNISTRVMSVKWYHFIPFVELVLITAISSSLLTGILLWATIHLTHSYTFLLIGFTAAHHHPEIFHEGDAPRKKLDWGLCQIDAVRDRIELKGNLLLNSILFGEHTLHHLFPTVDQSKLPLIEAAFEETCREFDVYYAPLTVPELLTGVFKQIQRTTPHTATPEDRAYEKAVAAQRNTVKTN